MLCFFIEWFVDVFFCDRSYPFQMYTTRKLANLFSMFQETCATQFGRMKTLGIQLASARTSCVQLTIFGCKLFDNLEILWLPGLRGLWRQLLSNFRVPSWFIGSGMMWLHLPLTMRLMQEHLYSLKLDGFVEYGWFTIQLCMLLGTHFILGFCADWVIMLPSWKFYIISVYRRVIILPPAGLIKVSVPTTLPSRTISAGILNPSYILFNFACNHGFGCTWLVVNIEWELLTTFSWIYILTL
jgi:hypothetical protein